MKSWKIFPACKEQTALFYETATEFNFHVLLLYNSALLSLGWFDASLYTKQSLEC